MRTAVFVSGRGSNLKAFLEENPSADIFVFSNKKKEPAAFKWARRRGVSTELVSLGDEKDWTDFASRLNGLKVSKVYLLGFMKIIPKGFLDSLNASCVNLHPSILPSFPGLNSIEKTFEARESMGCSLHEVSPEVDAGKMYLQNKISSPFFIFSKYTEQVHQAEQTLMAKYLDLNLELTGVC